MSKFTEDDGKKYLIDLAENEPHKFDLLVGMASELVYEGFGYWKIDFLSMILDELREGKV